MRRATRFPREFTTNFQRAGREPGAGSEPRRSSPGVARVLFARGTTYASRVTGESPCSYSVPGWDELFNDRDISQLREVN